MDAMKDVKTVLSDHITAIEKKVESSLSDQVGNLLIREINKLNMVEVEIKIIETGYKMISDLLTAKLGKLFEMMRELRLKNEEIEFVWGSLIDLTNKLFQKHYTNMKDIRRMSYDARKNSKGNGDQLKDNLIGFIETELILLRSKSEKEREKGLVKVTINNHGDNARNNFGNNDNSNNIVYGEIKQGK